MSTNTSKVMSFLRGLFFSPDRMYISDYYYYDRKGVLHLDTEAALQSDWYKRQVEAMRNIKRMQNDRHK
jgi:hypothetical protein